MRIVIVLGTRPEVIKMSPVIRECQARGLPFAVLHTGQHYSAELDRVFFEELGLPQPDRNLAVGSGPHGAQTGKMLAGIEAALMEDRPDAVLAEGDTNTVVAAALATVKLGVTFGHVEAGLRSGDRRMPEEINRVVADHVADLLFAPTPPCADTLRREGIPDERVFVTGNTIVDAVLHNRELARQKSDALTRLGLEAGGYVFMTAHRQENVDDPARFRGILAGAAELGRTLRVPVVYPIHPRARKMMQTFGLDAGPVRVVEPIGFLDSLWLQEHARLILTDSGGVQEEACVLGVPCVTLRDNTERPETLAVGANVLAGADAAAIVECGRRQLERPRGWAQPYGDGTAARQILDVLEGILSRPHAPREEGPSRGA